MGDEVSGTERCIDRDIVTANHQCPKYINLFLYWIQACAELCNDYEVPDIRLIPSTSPQNAALWRLCFSYAYSWLKRSERLYFFTHLKEPELLKYTQQWDNLSVPYDMQYAYQGEISCMYYPDWMGRKSVESGGELS